MSFDRARIHWMFTLAGVCLVMGALLAVQVRSNPPATRWLFSRFGVTGGGPIGALSQQLLDSQKLIKDQKTEVDDLRQQLSEYEQASSKEKGISKLMADQLADSKLALGLTQAEGPGIVLEVDDSPLSKNTNSGDMEGLEQAFLVHDTDLLQITNELWAVGAEAIAINDQRIVGGTAIRCVGAATMINYVPVTAPYRFIVLGDSDTLANSLNIAGGVLDRLRTLKFRLRLEKHAKLRVPPVATAKKFHNIKSVDEGNPPEAKEAATGGSRGR
jgi:uncharacterized protein YlxW (UPF0749 family)